MPTLTPSPRRHARRSTLQPLLALADTVRAARVAGGLTQDELALASGVGRRTIIGLENGRPGVSVGNAQRVLAVLRLKLAAVAV
jgi:transcriptional regulator with XRE-family HTH domain